MTRFASGLRFSALLLCIPALPTVAQSPAEHSLPEPSLFAETGLPNGTRIVMDDKGRVSECRLPPRSVKSDQFDRLCEAWKEKQKKARALVPIGGSKWIKPRDYPVSAMALGQQGSVQIKLHVNVRGRVKNCEILKSSGYADLDNQTCAILSKNARFIPRRDTNGRPVEGWYIRNVNWYP